MSKQTINGTDLMNMIFSGAQILHSQVKLINGLNVFPVPDGDTGTNMSMTLNSGIDMLNNNPSAQIGEVADTFAKGLLMGARGNSGVIMSQLFRGFAKGLSGLTEADSKQIATALQQGVNVAYEAVVKPVEGTILTVSREAAQHGAMMVSNTDDVAQLMRGVLNQAKETLSKTPEMLPVLKEAGVVDSGGQGLVCIYEGFCTVLEHDNVIIPQIHNVTGNDDVVDDVSSAQAHFETEHITYPYDMEFFIYLEKGKGASFNLNQFRKRLGKIGDSILVIEDDELIKVHVHTDEPGTVLNLAIRHGELGQFHIENMRDQHRSIVAQTTPGTSPGHALGAEATGKTGDMDETGEIKPLGVVAISIGDGLSDVFMNLGVDHVLAGGQTMNPSTENIIDAIESVRAETVFVLPNNTNILLAAKQASSFVDKQVIVLPSTSIPQGIAAMFALRHDAKLEDNVAAMEKALQEVKTGQVTYAVRDSKFNELDIKKGDFIGVYDGEIAVAEADVLQASQRLLQEIITDSDEILTIFVGEDAKSEQVSALIDFVSEHFPDVEIESHQGGQPLYHFIFSVE